MDERKAGITTATWPIITPSFFPDEAALWRRSCDVLEPWTAHRKSVFRRSFPKDAKKAWLIPLPTPLDGDLVLNATLPRGGLHEVALVSSNRSTVLRRAQWASQRGKRLTTGICGQRAPFVRVTPSGARGPGHRERVETLSVRPGMRARFASVAILAAVSSRVRQLCRTPRR